MISLSEYISHILSEITRARFMSDLETVRIAETYANDDLLKYFTVPRFKIQEMEITLPMLINTTDVEKSIILELDKEKFVLDVREEVDNLLRKYRSQLGMESSRMLEVISMIYKMYHLVATCNNESDILNCIKNLYPPIVARSMAIGMDKKGITQLNKTTLEKDLDFSMTQVYNYVMAALKVSDTKLRRVDIIPETKNIRTISNTQALFTVKMTLREEQIQLETLTDNAGNTRKVIQIDP